ncbi:major facilitator superfamily domain-containing protein 8-like [Oscarella lobularis]|uniref:major facilitator superfamily domain-containing protein 8-like n=1 Tax=Oscarella lobularis TaxID=121494 RepID=UPI0033133F27
MEASKKPAFLARWRSIRVMYLSMFFSSLGFTIVLASLWPFLLMVAGKGATPSLLGYIVAAFSLGQLIASPLIGFWSNRHGSKIPLLVTLTINVIGNFMYSYSNAIPSHDVKNAWFMLGSRFLVGIGAAITGVTRAYISGATSSDERTPAMANMSMAQALGFVLGPALALVFVPIGETGLQWKAIDLELNMYTGPGFLSGLLALINVICLLTLFVDYRLPTSQLTESQKNPINADDDAEALIQMSERKSPDKVGVTMSIILFFVVMFVFTVFETIASPLLMDEYAWTRKEATLYVGILFAISGIQAIVVFLIVKPLARRFGEIFMLGASLCFMLAGFFILLPFGSKYPPIRAHLIDPSLTNSSFQAESFVTNVPGMNITRYDSRGCSYDWCFSTPLIYFEQYLAGTFLIGIGYPTSTVMIYTIYSRLLGASPQGFMMGLMASFGCLARVLGPIFVSSLYHHQGPRWMFVAVESIVFVALLLFFGTYRRMRS